MSPPVDASDDRICLIGAGSSGLAAARVLTDRGLDFDGYELGSDVGGLWRFRNDSGRSPAYASLETNTSRGRTGFGAFPIPGSDAEYMRHAELLAYFERFAETYGLRQRFRFRTEVVRVAEEGAASAPRDPSSPGPSSRGRFSVTVRDREGGREETRRYGAVIVASGHHWDARLPSFPGRFDGRILHSRAYRSPREPEALEGRSVLVVGIGNSACDITVEVSRVAARTLMSTRRGAHVLPKWLFGRPLDRWITSPTSRLPTRVQAAALGLLVRLGRGDQRHFGLPVPEHALGREHPTLSQDLPELVREGKVLMRPDVAELEGSHVRFADGGRDPVDVIICATGYHVSFPFLTPRLLDRIDPAARDEAGAGRRNGRIRGNRVRFYHHVVPPDCPGLYFLGLVQPLGAIPPLAEAQAEWIGDLLAGEALLPEPAAMWRAIDRTEGDLRSRFVRSPRHTLEVDFFPYRRLLARERRRGRARARRMRAAAPDAQRERSARTVPA